MATIKTGAGGTVVMDNIWDMHVHLNGDGSGCATVTIDKSKPTFTISLKGEIVGEFKHRRYAEIFFAALVDDIACGIPDDGCRVTFPEDSRPTFDQCMACFRTGELGIRDWNFCASDSGPEYGWTAYIMGEGSEQCLASKHGFQSKDEIRELFATIGVKRVFPI